jgi:hypothetical protein
MSVQDWIDIPAVQAQSRHLTAVGAAVLTFLLLSSLVGWVVGPGFIRNLIEGTDGVVLASLVVVYGFRVVYYHAIKGSGGGHNVFMAA